MQQSTYLSRLRMYVKTVYVQTVRVCTTDHLIVEGSIISQEFHVHYWIFRINETITIYRTRGLTEQDNSIYFYVFWALCNSNLWRYQDFYFFLLLYRILFLPLGSWNRNLNNGLQLGFFFFFMFLFLMENTFTATKACYCMISYKCRELSENPFRINNTQTIPVNEKV